MSRGHARASSPHGGASAATQGAAALAAGKQTLTQQLAAPVQRRATAKTTADGPDVHAAAAHGTGGAPTQLPFLDQIQRSFGRHDVGRIRAHVDDRAAEGAGAMGAAAFAVGDRVAFAGAPDLHTAAHEAAHVVQQRGGVQLRGGVGEVGDAYEQHADAVADLVVRGESSEALLDRHAGPGAGQPGPASSAAVQRHAFVAGKQIKKSDPVARDAEVAPLIGDKMVRSYETEGELRDHAGKRTDYLGNLPDGTWLRFSRDGLNVLGENHTEVTLRMVTAAVGSRDFIDERLSNDRLAPGSKLGAAYEAENAGTFKDFGIAGEADKQRFGAESLFPKIGLVLTSLLPYLEGSEPGKLDKLTKDGDAEERKSKLGGYAGRPIQRYLKMAWGYAQDVKLQYALLQAVGRRVSPALTRLAKVVALVESDLDGFITGLPVEGFLGDALQRPENAQLWLPLAIFVRAVIHAMVERAVADPHSGIADDAERARFAKGAGDKDNQKMFAHWRTVQLEDSVKKAAHDKVRYAGMGAGHLSELRDHLPPATHPFDMDGDDLQGFQAETARLRSLAKP